MRFIHLIGAMAFTALLAAPSAANAGFALGAYGLPGAQFTAAFPAPPAEKKSEATADRPATVSYRYSNDSNLLFASVIGTQAAPGEEAALLDKSVAALTAPPTGVPLDEKSISEVTVDGVKGKRITGSSGKLRYVGYFFVHKGRIFVIHGVSRPPGDAVAAKASDDFVESFRLVGK